MGADAKEEGLAADGIRVGQGGGEELAGDVGSHGLEGRQKIRGPLKEVIAVGDALPGDRDTRHAGGGMEQA